MWLTFSLLPRLEYIFTLFSDEKKEEAKKAPEEEKKEGEEAETEEKMETDTTEEATKEEATEESTEKSNWVVNLFVKRKWAEQLPNVKPIPGFCEFILALWLGVALNFLISYERGGRRSGQNSAIWIIRTI